MSNEYPKRFVEIREKYQHILVEKSVLSGVLVSSVLDLRHLLEVHEYFCKFLRLV